MAPALPVYAVASLLLVASVGPITAGVRDASLADFEALDEPRPLDSFPFLKQVRPYLPPLVVEWLIVKQSLNLPDGGDFHVDDDGRIIVVWPDGCEENHDTYLSGSVCDEDPCNDPEPDPARCGEPCLLPEDDPDRPNDCDPDVPPLDCDDGQVPARNQSTGAPECIPDPACDRDADDPERPDDCPDVAPPEPPEPTCPEGHLKDNRGDCVPHAEQDVRGYQGTNVAENKMLPVTLRLDFEYLKLDVDWAGLPTPTFEIRLVNADSPDEFICWNRDDGNQDNVCTISNPGPLNGADTWTFIDAVDGPIPEGRYTLSITYEPAQPEQTSGSRLDVQLYGKPQG